MTDTEEGMSLEDAVRGVDAREYIELLDKVRSSQENLYKFVTAIAKEAPPIFRRFAERCGFGADNEVDTAIRNGKIIEAIKIHRNKTGAMLRESKDYVDKRRVELGFPPPTF